MSPKNLIIGGAAVLLLSGCAANSSSIAVTVPNEPVLRGDIKWPWFSPTSIQFSNGTLTCSGSGDNSQAVVCNDGRKGLVTGSVLTLNDGTTAQVFIGDAANAF